MTSRSFPKKILSMVLGAILLWPEGGAKAGEVFDLLSADQAGLDSRAAPEPAPIQEKKGGGQEHLSRPALPPERFRPGDVVRVGVYGEPDLTRLHRIDETGKIYVLLIGAVDAAGLTRKGLEEAIAGKLKKGYLLNPKVTVDRPAGLCPDKL